MERFFDMHYLTSLAAPVLIPTAMLLRPRFGRFPLLLAILCVLWVLLLRLAFPRQRRWLTPLTAAGSLLLLLTWLPRIAGNSWGQALLTPTFYRFFLLPAVFVQVTMLTTLATTPLWLPLALLKKRRERSHAPPVPPAPPAAEAPAAASPAAAPLASRRQALVQLSAIPLAIPGTSAVLAAYGVFLESQSLRVRRLRVEIPGLPPSLRGLRIGQITDSHVSPDLTPLRQLERGCELLAGERLDLLVTTGDMCDHPRLMADVLRLISAVPARLGRYACLGNHELYLDTGLVLRSYERSAVQLLVDENVRIGELTLAAIGYPHARSSRLAHDRVAPMLDRALHQRAAGTTTLLLSHHPHVVQHLQGRDVQLMMAGHTHGGQLGLGPLGARGDLSLAEPLYRYARGLYQLPQAQLFVGSGLGHWLPWRVGCPPEVVVLELA